MTTWTGTLPTVAGGLTILGTDIDTLRDAIAALVEGWTSYTPVWSSSGTQPALGNGAISGSYLQAGKLVIVRGKLLIGSTSTFGTGVYSVSLPVTPIVDQLIPMVAKDISAATRYAGHAEIIAASATGDNMRIALSDATLSASATNPFTWATNDTLIWEGVYQAS